MSTFLEVTVKYGRVNENGQEKKVTETYLVDAVTFAEAEARIYKELENLASGVFNIASIKRTNLAEIIPGRGDRWYKAKETFITFDEVTGKEKRISQFVLVFADTPRNANDEVLEAMRGMMADFEISSIAESPIVDIFHYESEKVS